MKEKPAWKNTKHSSREAAKIPREEKKKMRGERIDLYAQQMSGPKKQ